MTTFVAALRHHCAELTGHALWLLAPSETVGRQWLAQVSRYGVRTEHVRVRTLWEIALELVRPTTPRLEERLLSENGIRVVVDRLWPMVKAHQKEGYFSQLEMSPGLTTALADTVMALRRAGVQTGQFHAEAFDNPAKGIELAQLLTAYELRLQLSRLLDEADIWKAAAELLLDRQAVFPDNVRLLIPEIVDARTHGLAATVLQLLPTEITVSLPTDEPASPMEEDTFLADRQLLRWLHEPMSAPPQRGDQTLGMFRAVCEADEMREVLRRCASGRIPLGEVEVLYTDTDLYQPILMDLLATVAAADERLNDVPLTLGDGLPVQRTRPGRALKAWLAWVDADYRQSLFLHLLHEGLLNEPATPSTGLLRLLRSLPIGWGRNRYQQCIQARLHSEEEVVVLDEEEELIAETLTTEGQELERFWEQLQPLLQLLPAEPAPDDWLYAALRFVREYAPCNDENDRQARDLLDSALTDLRRWVGLEETALRWDVHAWLRSLPEQLRLPGQIPKTGFLHAAHWSQGGHSGRPYTFLVGLDDARFPGGKLPHVLLMSSERQQLSPELPTDGRLREEQRQQFLRLVRSLPGRITVSFACFDILENRERFPSWVVRGVFRLLTGQEETDQKKLEEFLGQPVGYTPTSERHCLTEGQWWHYQLFNPPRIDRVADLLSQRYPHLAQGILAQQARSSPQWTSFDGLVPEAGRDLDPSTAHGMILSASRLESLARCPLSFFFQHVLEAVAPPEITLDPSVWLSPMARRELVQEVFRAYHEQLQQEGTVPDEPRDWPRLLELLHTRVARYLKRYPCPSAHALQNEFVQLEQAVRMFLRDEVQNAGAARPLHLNVSLGIEKTRQPTPLDSPEPVRVPLGNGLTLRLRGRIDRLDATGTGESQSYSITNYKLGSSARYQDATDLREGRILQHVVTYELVQAHLRAVHGPEAKVQQFNLFFPGERGQGDRLQWTAEQMQEEKAKLVQLITLLASGAFPPTNKSADCAYCEHKKVCSIPGDTQASQQKLNQAANDMLNPYRELRHAKKR